MQIADILAAAGVILTLLSFIVGFLWKEIRDIDRRLRQTSSTEELRQIIDDKIRPLLVDGDSIKTDISKIESALLRLERILLEKGYPNYYNKGQEKR